MNYITILSFMIKDLNLKGNELILYALIYGFSQDDKSFFKGSYEFIHDITNISRRQVMRVLESLSKKGLIKIFTNKDDKENVVNKYKAIKPYCSVSCSREFKEEMKDLMKKI